MKSIWFAVASCFFSITSCEIMPRNTLSDCQQQCKDSKKKQACMVFCDCIHQEGRPLDSCLDEYNRAPKDSIEKHLESK